VDAALLQLNERTRDVFVLSRLERMKYAEIAEMYGISVSAVEKHMIKALAHLARRVRGVGVERLVVLPGRDGCGVPMRCFPRLRRLMMDMTTMTTGMMVGMGLYHIIIVIFALVGTAASIKYLRS